MPRKSRPRIIVITSILIALTAIAVNANWGSGFGLSLFTANDASSAQRSGSRNKATNDTDNVFSPLAAGDVDPSFSLKTGFDGGVLAMLVQADGKIVVGGNFVSFNGETTNRMARLNADSSLDSSFSIGTVSQILQLLTMLVQWQFRWIRNLLLVENLRLLTE